MPPSHIEMKLAVARILSNQPVFDGTPVDLNRLLLNCCYLDQQTSKIMTKRVAVRKVSSQCTTALTQSGVGIGWRVSFKISIMNRWNCPNSLMHLGPRVFWKCGGNGENYTMTYNESLVNGGTFFQLFFGMGIPSRMYEQVPKVHFCLTFQGELSRQSCNPPSPTAKRQEILRLPTTQPPSLLSRQDEITTIIGFWRVGCPRGVDNWGTLRIPFGKIGGTFGNIRGITRPP